MKAMLTAARRITNLGTPTLRALADRGALPVTRGPAGRRIFDVRDLLLLRAIAPGPWPPGRKPATIDRPLPLPARPRAAPRETPGP